MKKGESRVKQGGAQGKAENAARRNAVEIFLARITWTTVGKFFYYRPFYG
ncbi:MAG TPA: hypothetical protein VFB27_02865 [Opitutaceae bacterium]|nr:hypothetical protein [Opitutaceae bacterium]